MNRVAIKNILQYQAKKVWVYEREKEKDIENKHNLRVDNLKKREIPGEIEFHALEICL